MADVFWTSTLASVAEADEPSAWFLVRVDGGAVGGALDVPKQVSLDRLISLITAQVVATISSGEFSIAWPTSDPGEAGAPYLDGNEPRVSTGTPAT